MRKYIESAIFQFISILMLAAGIALCWAGYVYEGMPLVSAICFTIVDTILLIFYASEYIFVISHFNSELEKKDKEPTE